MEKRIRKRLKDEFGFVESDFNNTCKTVITFLSDIIDAKLNEIKDLKDANYKLEVDLKNSEIMIDELQKEKEVIRR